MKVFLLTPFLIAGQILDSISVTLRNYSSIGIYLSALPQQSYVKMIIYDIMGREVATLVDGFKNAGIYSVVWNTTRCASGVYFYRLTMGDYHSIKKLLLMK